MITIRTAVLHNGVDASVEYANNLAQQIDDECVVVNAFTHASLKESLPIRAVPNVMVCLFCEGMEEYQEVVDIIHQLEYIKLQPENEATMHTAGTMLTDEQAVTVPLLYEEWRVGVELSVDDRVRRDEKLYKVLQAHTTQEGWEPEATPALFVEVAAPGEYREIKDNMLSTEAFAKGEIGWYKTKDNLYESLFDGNVYTPDSYPDGWQKVGE